MEVECVTDNTDILLVSNQENKGRIKHYTIMFEDHPVLSFNRETDEVQILEKKHLPFAFRNKGKISATAVSDWITDRVSNINRTYMNIVYIARKVGRDKNKIIQDSSGISFTDNFWIKTSDITTTWDELKKLRDSNTALGSVALTGKMDTSKDLLEGYTSLFTTKGYFPKAILGQYLYKRKEDAILEYPAYLIGLQMGVNMAECSIENNYVKIRIFTDLQTSLVHASELKEYFDTDEVIYNSIKEIGRQDIIKQLQEMYIFNFIIGNPDLHDDNYGLLYNAQTFDFISLCPCYDHNMAFQEGFNGLSRTTMGNSASAPLDDWTKLFIVYHPDIVAKLKKLDLSEVQNYLSTQQLKELKERITQTIAWGE